MDLYCLLGQQIIGSWSLYRLFVTQDLIAASQRSKKEGQLMPCFFALLCLDDVLFKFFCFPSLSRLPTSYCDCQLWSSRARWTWGKGRRFDERHCWIIWRWVIGANFVLFRTSERVCMGLLLIVCAMSDKLFVFKSGLYSKSLSLVYNLEDYLFMNISCSYEREKEINCLISQKSTSCLFKSAQVFYLWLQLAKVIFNTARSSFLMTNPSACFHCNDMLIRTVIPNHFSASFKCPRKRSTLFHSTIRNHPLDWHATFRLS